jgi:acyl transferase domain-containing protein
MHGVRRGPTIETVQGSDGPTMYGQGGQWAGNGRGNGNGAPDLAQTIDDMRKRLRTLEKFKRDTGEQLEQLESNPAVQFDPVQRLGELLQAKEQAEAHLEACQARAQAAKSAADGFLVSSESKAAAQATLARETKIERILRRRLRELERELEQLAERRGPYAERDAERRYRSHNGQNDDDQDDDADDDSDDDERAG